MTIMQLYALFMFLWWATAAAILTFFDPFRVTTNAYFAIWAATIASTLLLSTSFQKVAAPSTGSRRRASPLIHPLVTPLAFALSLMHASQPA